MGFEEGTGGRFPLVDGTDDAPPPDAGNDGFEPPVVAGPDAGDDGLEPPVVTGPDEGGEPPEPEKSPAKHFVIKGTSVFPFGVRESAYDESKEPAPQPR